MGHQTKILENLSQYLCLSYKEIYTDNSQQIPVEFLEIVKSLDNGHCFGFSLIHAAMDDVDKLIWWESVLELLETWDGNPELLKQKISERSDFKQIVPSDVPEEKKKDFTLGDLFERVANYIVYHQAGVEIPFRSQDLNQLSMLQPNQNGNHHFEMLDAKGNLLTIKDRKIVDLGDLSLEEVSTALNNDSPEMSLVHSAGHTIRVGVHDGRWFVYDPNYERNDKDSPYKYLKYFPDKTAAINEVFRIQGHALAIEVASTRKEIIALPINYQGIISKFIKNNHISGSALSHLSVFAPDDFKKILSDMNKDDSLQGQQLKECFAKALIEKMDEGDYGGFTALQIIAIKTPDCLTQLLTLMNDSPQDQQFKESFAKALIEKNNDGWTGLHTIARNAPAALTALITHMNKEDNSPQGKQLKENFAKALVAQAKDGTTGLHSVSNVPDAIMQLVTLMDNSPQGQLLIETFTKALNEKTNDETGLNMIAKNAPNVLTQFIPIMDNSQKAHQLIENFANTLTETGLSVIANYAPDALKQIIAILDNSPEGQQLTETFAKTLIEKTDYGTGLHMIAVVAPDALKPLITHMNKDNSFQGQQLKEKLAKALVEKMDEGGWTALQMIAISVPDVITPLITLMDDSFQGKQLKESFARALIVKNDDGWTGLHTIVRNAPDALTSLITLMNKDNSQQGHQLKESFAKALMEQSNDGTTGLQSIVSDVPDAITQLITLMDYLSQDQQLNQSFANALMQLIMNMDNSLESQQLKTNFAKALIEKNNNHWTGLQMITRYTPDVLKQLITLMDDSSEGKQISESFAQALIEKKNDGWTGLHMMAMNAPDTLIQLIITHMNDSSQGQKLRENFVKALFEKDYYGQTGLDVAAGWGAQFIANMVQQVASTFTDVQTGGSLKARIYQELVKNELGKPSPNLDIILSALSQGKQVLLMRYNESPFNTPNGQQIYLTIAEQAIARACNMNNPKLFETVVSELKKENMTLDTTMVKKIASTFYNSEWQTETWISQELAKFTTQQENPRHSENTTPQIAGNRYGFLSHSEQQKPSSSTDEIKAEGDLKTSFDRNVK